MNRRAFDRRLRRLSRARRAIALDFQGVLFVDRPRDVHEDASLGLVSLVDLLPPLLDGHDDLVVVVTSSWRAQLDDDGLLERIPSLEPWYAGSVGRPEQGRNVALRRWLTEHPQIKSFVALDDQERLYRGNWPELIVCDSSLGLRDESAWMTLATWVNTG